MDAIGWTTGAIAGIFAGIVMSVWKMIQGAMDGSGFWRPPNLIATIMLGHGADRHDFAFGPFLVGMTLHLLTSAGMGILYALVIDPLLHHPGGWLLVLAAVVYALLSWAVYQYLVMPWLAPIMNRNVRPFWLAVAHVVYGVAFALWIMGVNVM